MCVHHIACFYKNQAVLVFLHQKKTARLFQGLAGGEDVRVAMLLPAVAQAYFTLGGAETAGVVLPTLLGMRSPALVRDYWRSVIRSRYSCQFTHCKPETRENSRTLRVTRVA